MRTRSAPYEKRPREVRAKTSRWEAILPWLPLILGCATWEVFAFASGGHFVPHIHVLILTVFQSFLGDPIIEAEGGGALGYAPHVWATLRLFLVSFALGTVSAFFVSVMCYPWILLRRTFEATLSPWHVVPPLVVIPLSFILFDPSESMFYLTISFYAFIATSIYVLAALRDVSPNYINMARIAGAGPLWIAWKVRAPSVLPVLLGPLKVVSSFTLGVTVVLEFLAVPKGIGRVMKFAVSYNSVLLILTGIFWSALIGLVSGICLDKLGKTFLRWGIKAESEDAPMPALDAAKFVGR